MARSLFTQLEIEWERVGRAVPAKRALRRWKDEDPHLEPFEDLFDLVEFAREPGHTAASDAVLYSLARRARDEDLAARVLLQAVLYALINIAAQFRPAASSPEDSASIVVAAAYERIRTYPLERRPQRIATNIILDTRQAVSRSLCRRRVFEVPAYESLSRVPSEPPVTTTVDMLEVVRTAVHKKQLAEGDAQLIVLTRLVGVPMKEVAAERGCLPHSLRRRRLRAEAALAAAVA